MNCQVQHFSDWLDLREPIQAMPLAPCFEFRVSFSFGRFIQMDLLDFLRRGRVRHLNPYRGRTWGRLTSPGPPDGDADADSVMTRVIIIL